MVGTNLHSILANQTNVTLARNQRVVASWLPPPSPSGNGQPQNGPELEEEDGHAFVPELEFLGLGQALPKDAESAQVNNLSSDAKLRRQLLGRNRDKLKRPNSGNMLGRKHSATKPSDSRTDRRRCESSSEDEPGRSALGRSVLAKSRRRMSSEDETTDNQENHTRLDDASNGSQQPTVGEGRAKAPDVGTRYYLDQVLAEKARKMRKKRKKKMRKERMRKGDEAGPTVQASR